MVSLQTLSKLLSKVIPQDHSKQVVSEYYVHGLLKEYENSEVLEVVMDLGCGLGNSIDLFRHKNPNIKWIGLDIMSSPEVNARKRTDGIFSSYDGINIPFRSNSFDLVYSNQVFEHVRYPRELLKEVNRVLKPGGYFIGSTSQLEPYHSYSLWNYTIYGFFLLLEEANFCLIEIRPSVDSLTLIIRRGLGRPKFFSTFWIKESPLNVMIEIIAKIIRKKAREINLLKLVFCGQFCFWARKPKNH